MALSASTLSTELQAMGPVDNEADGINNFATAFDNYFQGASVNGTPVAGGATSAAKSAMISAMSGAGAPNAGALAIQTGITAYWGVIIPAAIATWPSTPPVITATPPPTLATIAAALTPVFAANTSGSLSLADSADAIAQALHPTQLGGIAICGPPPPGGAPVPIL